MKTYSHDALGYNAMFCWSLTAVHRPWGFWWVSGRGPFTHRGYGVMDDFGELVEAGV